MSEIIDIKSKIKNINAVIGCKIGCRYCYAKAVAKRFHLTDDFLIFLNKILELLEYI